MRDLYIMLDGQATQCRERLPGEAGWQGGLGNVLTEDLATIWARGAALYGAHCGARYDGICRDCDEYYTYNF
jgi:hypothetical protein